VAEAADAGYPPNDPILWSWRGQHVGECLSRTGGNVVSRCGQRIQVLIDEHHPLRTDEAAMDRFVASVPIKSAQAVSLGGRSRR
jgi:hypothetical protein